MPSNPFTQRGRVEQAGPALQTLCWKSHCADRYSHQVLANPNCLQSPYLHPSVPGALKAEASPGRLGAAGAEGTDLPLAALAQEVWVLPSHRSLPQAQDLQEKCWPPTSLAPRSHRNHMGEFRANAKLSVGSKVRPGWEAPSTALFPFWAQPGKKSWLPRSGWGPSHWLPSTALHLLHATDFLSTENQPGHHLGARLDPNP